MEQFSLTVEPQDTGNRLDRFVASACGISRSLAQGLLAKGNILVNGSVPAKSYAVQQGDIVSICIPPPSEIEAVPQDIPLDIVYEDAHLLVVNKPKGMVVHPAAGNPDGTLVNALLHHCGTGLSGIGGEIRPGIVHRIDKNTSGLLVVAKDDATHAGLSAQFAAHSIQREYQAIVYGGIKQQEGTIDAPVGRSPNDRKKMAVVGRGGRRAVTHWRVIGRYNGFTHLALRLETGRTHQIRVHMASTGHPVAGDEVYGPKKVIRELEGQCLHAKTLGFTHPATGKWLQLDSELPPYFVQYLAKLERNQRE